MFAKVTGKWQVLILLSLEDGALRFNEIRRAVGDVTQRVLTENLRSLERDGYLSRTVKAGPPVAVSFELTPLGLSLVQVLKGVVAWANDSFPRPAARPITTSASRKGRVLGYLRARPLDQGHAL